MGKSPASIATLVGSALATASALLGVWLMSYGYATGGFRNHDPLLIAASRTGLVLSLAAALCASIGLRPASRLRCLGLAFALAGLLFWVGSILTGRL
jgi:hypothetical protein